MPRTKQENDRIRSFTTLNKPKSYADSLQKQIQDLEYLCKCQQVELEAIKVRLAFDSPGIEFVLPVREDIP